MDNNTLQLKIKQRLNKLASFDFDNLECWQMIEAFNKAQVSWCRRQLHGTNTRNTGDEASKRRVDDLEILLVHELIAGVDVQYVPVPINPENPNEGTVSEFGYYEVDIEDIYDNTYLEFKRIKCEAFNECCGKGIAVKDIPDSDPPPPPPPPPPPHELYDPSTNPEGVLGYAGDRSMTVYLTEVANIDLILRDPLKRPDFEWGETVVTLQNKKLRIWRRDFEIATPITFIYYRKPRYIEIQGCIDPYTGEQSLENIECEFKDDIVEVLIDDTCAVIAGDISDGNQFARGENQSEKNN